MGIRGFTVFAVQWDWECYTAADAEKTYTKYGTASNCKNGTGGIWANDVYKIFITPKITPKGEIEVATKKITTEPTEIQVDKETGEVKVVTKKITAKLAATCFETGKGYLYNDIKHMKNTTTPEDCQKECQKNEECVVWTLDSKLSVAHGGCWLHRLGDKRQLPGRHSGSHLTSGPKFCKGKSCSDVKVNISTTTKPGSIDRIQIEGKDYAIKNTQDDCIKECENVAD